MNFWDFIDKHHDFIFNQIEFLIIISPLLLVGLVPVIREIKRKS